MNSVFIIEFYSDFFTDPESLPECWKKFFEGLSDKEKLILDNLRGPSWSPEKKFTKVKIELENKNKERESSTDLNSKSVKQASKDLSEQLC